MTDITKIHRRAMAELDNSLLARSRGDEPLASRHLGAAYRLEAKAANELLNAFDLEPSRSVLFRGAAALARDCGLYMEAAQLLHRGLSGNPPPDIASEMQDLLEEVTFARHLQVRGIELGADEVQMAITGREVGFGMAATSVLLARIQTTESLLYRTAERELHREYRDRGRRDSSVSQLYVSVPRAASLAITFRVGTLQDTLPGLSNGERIVDEFLSCLELFTTGVVDKLQERIGDEAYYRNFIGLARNLQPDGTKVNMVGFTSLKQGRARYVTLRKRPDENQPIANVDLVDAKAKEKLQKPVRIRGELRFADITSRSGKESNEIKIVTNRQQIVSIVVPPGMMDDIVKPLWRSEVEIIGEQRGNKVHLSEIIPVEDQEDH